MATFSKTLSTEGKTKSSDILKAEVADLKLSVEKAKEDNKKQAEDNKKQMDDVMNSNKKLTEDNKKQMDLMMRRLAEIDSKTPAGITKRNSRSKSRNRISTVVERREVLAARTPFGGVPINQTGGAGTRVNSKLGFMTPRDLDDSTNNSL
jgi:predicted phage gp36 major capsid-like protein